MASSNIISEVEIKTGVSLPKTSRLLASREDHSRSDVQSWLFQIDIHDQVQLPTPLRKLSGASSQDSVRIIERVAGASIVDPKTSGYGGRGAPRPPHIWQGVFALKSVAL
jgi:hypothetical protein